MRLKLTEILFQRLFTGWTFLRALYFVMGSLIVIQAGMAGQFLGIFLGTYFGSMGLLGFGCAMGNCSVSTIEKPTTVPVKEFENEIHFEEIKQK